MEGRENELWERADAILDQLLDLPETSRAEALRAMQLPADEHACVERLLRAHDGVGALDRPPRDPAWAAPSTLVGRKVGDWVLERELGRGGMAVVWQASRGTDETMQRAAIKLFPVGALARHEMARFRREQAILARLNHPHIAHLYEAGEAEDGTPYLAMEKVEGQRIDVWCERRGLDVRARVRLVLNVCAAIAYAHRSLVVHADLKPSNVLVDNEGHVRVLDFGIGRLLDERMAELTGTLWRAVTPEYAAPEQLRGEPANTAADVFGLGALLYRLLAGTGPRDAGAGDAVVPPSRALRTAAKGDGPLQVQQIRGDLDTVVLKALCAEPERRYASVDAFGDDLRAWLDRRPIAARGPSWRYWLRKFVDRNRLAVAAAVALTLAVMLGLATTVWQARRARTQTVAARLQADRAVAVKNVLLKLLQRTHPGVVAGDPPASQLLREGSEDIRKNTTLEPAVRAELLRVIGYSQGGRGWYKDADDTLRAALTLYDSDKLHDTAGQAETLQRLAWIRLNSNDADGGIATMRKADALLGGDKRTFTQLHDKVRAALIDMLTYAGRRGEARPLASDLLARLRRQGRSQTPVYASVLRSLGAGADIGHHPLKAIAWQTQAEQVLNLDAAKNAPGLAMLHNELGLANWHAGRFDAAEREFRQAVQGYVKVYGAHHPLTLIVRRHLAAVHMDQGRVAEAVDELDATRRQLIGVRGDRPGRDLARTDYWLAVGHYRMGDTATALAQARSAWRMALRQEQGFRRQYDTMAPLVGLLEFEQGDGQAGELLASGASICGSSWPPAAVRRWICIARALRAADHGRCRVPALEPPSSPPADGIDRRWWAAYYLVRARCGSDATRDTEARQAQRLAPGAAPAFPRWLRHRLEQVLAGR